MLPHKLLKLAFILWPIHFPVAQYVRDGFFTATLILWVGVDIGFTKNFVPFVPHLLIPRLRGYFLAFATIWKSVADSVR